MARTPTTTTKEVAVSYSIVSLTRVEEPAVAALALGTTIPGRAGVQAVVRLAGGGRLNVSRLDGSPRWVVDGEWAPGRSFPKFWNGWFSRCTLLVDASPDLAEFLTEEAHWAEVNAAQTAAEAAD